MDTTSGTPAVKKVLIIEDDADLRSILAGELGPKYQVLQAEDGQKGFALTTELKPDLILLDLQLPLLDGLDVLQAIREYPDQTISMVKVIVFSNFGDTERIQRAQKLGISDYMIKANMSINNVITRIDTVFKGI